MKLIFLFLLSYNSLGDPMNIQEFFNEENLSFEELLTQFLKQKIKEKEI